MTIDREFVALGMAAEIVMIIEDQYASIRMILQVEVLLVIQKTLLSIRSAFNFVFDNVVCGMALNLSFLFKDINQEKILVLSDLIVRNYS